MGNMPRADITSRDHVTYDATTADAGEHPLARQLLWYAVLVALPLLLLLLALRAGQLRFPGGTSRPAALLPTLVPAEMAVLRPALLLGQLVLILGVSRLCGRAFARLGQPRVMGEMLAGVVLGPSLLGLVWPAAYAMMFPRGSVRFLNALSQVGLILFMFLVGLEVDLKGMRRQRGLVLLTAHAGIAIPLCLGVLASFTLYPLFATAGVTFVSFASFVGVALSVTAFPVLARILGDAPWRGTRLAEIALSSAAVSDVTAWGILAIVIAVGRDSATAVPLWATALGLAAFVAFMTTVGRRVVGFLADRLSRDGGFERVNEDALAAVVIVAMSCAVVTELLGVHALFGAFLAGVIMPKDREVVAAIEVRLREILAVVLLPIFFAFTGLRLRVGLIEGRAMWMALALVVAAAIAGKVGGTALAARLWRFRWRESLSLGAMMNTRGLMELVVLSIGLDAGIISPPLYAILVVMALVTTFMTAPLLRLSARRWATAERPALAGHVTTP